MFNNEVVNNSKKQLIIRTYIGKMKWTSESESEQEQNKCVKVRTEIIKIFFMWRKKNVYCKCSASST